MPEEESWQDKVKKYCEKYNVPILYLSDTLYEPKVVPMIRGKSFEFSVMVALQEILPTSVWEVIKTPSNAQMGVHDVDVLIKHRSPEREFRVECKLASKGSFRSTNGGFELEVKCMRSRTLGQSMVETLAPQLGVTKRQLTTHNDQYLPADFDIVATSIGNAFYETDSATGLFEWKPSATAVEFLHMICGEHTENSNDLKDLAFNKIYVAKSQDLAITASNNITCTRRRCTSKRNCGFIPNYPKIIFRSGKTTPERPWVEIGNIQKLILES